MDDLDGAIEDTFKANDKARSTVTAVDPLDSAVDSVLDNEKVRQRATVRSAVQVNPDIAAKANTLAVKNNLPHELVLRNMPEVLQRDMTEQIDALLTTSPALARKMRDMPFAQMAHDNVENLAGIEKQLKTYGEFRALRGPEPTVGSYLTGVWESVVGRAKQADIGLSMQVADIFEAMGATPDPARRQELVRRYDQANAQVRTTTPEFDTDTSRGVYGGVSSTVSALPPLALSIMTRNPNIGLAAMGLQTESEAFGKYRARGASAGEALLGGVGEGAVEVLTEKLPMGFLVDKFGKTGAKQFLSGMLLREVPSEQVATLLQDAIDTAVANPGKTWGEFAAERPGAAYQTLLATLVQAGTMGGASTVVQKIAERAQRQQQVADQDSEALTNLLAMAEKDKLRERDPSAFASMVQAAAEQHGAPTEVFIDANALADTLAQSGMTPQQIAAALPSTSGQIAEAVAAGGDVAVPIGEFTALVAGSGMEAQLVKHTRFSPDALSQEDAKTLAQVDLKAEAEKIVQEAGDELDAQATSVRSQVLAQLEEAGRHTPAVNEAYADSVSAFYETTAARLGIPAADLWAKYPLTVKAEITPGASLEQLPAEQRMRLEAEVQQIIQQIEARGSNPDTTAAALNTADRARINTIRRYIGAMTNEPAFNQSSTMRVVAPGDKVDGRVVREEIPNMSSIGASLDNYETLPGVRDVPMSEFDASYVNSVKWERLDARTQKLAEEIRESGELNPLIIALDAEGAYVIEGGHRFDALIAIGAKSIPAKVVIDLDNPPAGFEQKARGTFTPSTNTITLLASADLSTFLHETGHFYLEVLADLAAQPNAPESITKDMQTLLEWFGHKGTVAEWTAQDLDTRRDAHEKFARGFEAYLLEGKAPNTALSRVFGRFRSWLVSIYKNIRALNVEINDDIRQVFDRLLATDQAIKEAEAARNYAPLFADEKTLDEAGVDPAAYHALGAEATAEAVDALASRSMRDLRWLANAKSRALKALQKDAAEKRKAIEAQVREEVGRQPVYAAENFLRRGVLPVDERNNAQRKALDETQGMPTKLDLPTLKGMYGEDPAAPWRYLPTGKTGLAASEGLHPDVVAEIFGFPSGDALVRELLAAEPQAQVIEGMTDQRMLEEHGELSSPDALERAAEQAIRNEARGRFIATELAALDKAIGPVRVLVTAAKQFAASVIGRKKINEIKPHLFAAAETRSAKLAEKSLGKSTEEAAQAKRNQLLNHYAARYAHEARDEIARVREFFARVANTPDDKLKSRDLDVVNAARAVLAAYGVGRRGEAAAEYLKKVAAYDPDMSGVLQGSVDAALQNAKPLDELTLDELRALNDEVAALWHLAKRSRQMEVDGELLDREQVQDDLKARLEEIGIPDTMPGDLSAITPGEARVAKLKTYLASARRTEGWVEAMDGKSTGAFRSFIWQPVKEAADAYRADKAAVLKKFRALLKPIEGTLTKRLVAAPELGYTFGRDTGGVALNEILHAIAHTGNESNKRKLLLGRKWATERADGTLDTSRWDAFVDRMAAEGVLKKEHFDFVQGVWDLLEETKPLAQKTHRDVFGKYFAEITADALDTPFGQYRGGYVPAQADPRVVSDAKTRQLMEAENESMTFAFPATNKGFTKGRVEYNRPLMLDLGTLAQHIDKVLLFGHMERPIRDVRRVLTSKGVAYGVNRIDPAAFDAIISPWLNRAARQQVTTPTPGHWQSWRLWSTLRNRAGMAAMFGNVVNAVQQVTGFSIAAVKVRPKYMLGAMADYVKNPRQMANDVAEASPYMEGRMRNEVSAMNDQIKDILIDPALYERTQQWTMRHAYFLQSAVDNVMSPIIWTAARNQALEQGQSEKEATRFADATVRQTQGSTLPEDISNFEAGSSFSRMFTQFAGYFNMQANLGGTELQKIARDIGLRKGAGKGLYVLTMGFFIPAWISELIVQAFKGGPDDEDKDGEYLDDWLAAVFGFSTLRGLTAMVPIFGQGINAIPNALNSKPYDDRLGTSPAISMIEAAVRAPIDVYKAAFEDGDKSKAVKEVASLISLLTGIPANIAARPLSYAADVAEGDVTPTSPADAARGLVTGRASPESKR